MIVHYANYLIFAGIVALVATYLNIVSRFLAASERGEAPAVRLKSPAPESAANSTGVLCAELAHGR